MGARLKVWGLGGVLLLVGAPAVADEVATWENGALDVDTYRACQTATRRKDSEESRLACALDYWLADTGEQYCAMDPALDDLVLRRRAQLITPLLRAHIAENIKISDEEVQNALAKHRAAKAALPLKFYLRHIFIYADSEGIAQGTEQLSQVRNELLAGGDFAGYAREISQSANRFQGGRLGRLEINRLPKPLADKVEALQPGEITEPIAYGEGVYLFKRDAPPVIKARNELTTQRVRQILLKREIKAQMQKILTAGAEGFVSATPPGGSGLYRMSTPDTDGGEAANDWRDAARALLNHARSRGIDSSPEIAATMNWVPKEVCAQRYFAHKLDNKIGSPTGDDLLSLYDANPTRYTAPELFRVSAIQFSDHGDELSPGDFEQYLAVERKIREGELDFSTAAKQHSLDDTATLGGELGAKTIAQLAAQGFALSRALRSMTPGELTGLIHLSNGIWLYRLDERVQTRPIPFAEARAQLTRDWMSQQRTASTEALRADYQKQARIELIPPVL